MKTYLIVGASSDISIAYLKHLESKAEKCVAICQYCSHKDELVEMANTFNYVEIMPIRCDLSDKEQLTAMINGIKEKNYEVDHVLHAPAGRFNTISLKKTDCDDIRREMDIEVFSFIEIMKAFLPDMAKKRYGKVVVMLSSCTIGIPPETFTEYVTAKYALLGAMRAISSEYVGKGIQINGISPAMVETKLLNNLHEIFIDANAKNSPMKRNLVSGDVIPAIVFLMDDDNRFMNGVNINLSGGVVL